MTNKDKYIEFCRQKRDIPVFSQVWWMDAVCLKDNWDVLLYEKGNEILGALPYYMKKKFGKYYIIMPPLTQNNGVVIKYPENQKYEQRLSYEKVIMTALIEQLEKLPIIYYQQRFCCDYTNWLPFYWKGYKQTTYYTYRINSISDVESVFNDFDYSKKKNIKKASTQVNVFYDLSAEEFYENHKLTLKKQNAVISYPFELFKRIYDAAYTEGNGRVIYCKDKQDNIHAALFVIWDKKVAYDLISTIDPDFRNSGAASLIVYEMIKNISPIVDIFDFEGSMIEMVENSFRKFGTKQTPYFVINKIFTKNILLKLGIDYILNR